MLNPNLDAASGRLSAAEKEFERSVRPSDFANFFGQEQVIDNIVVFVKAAKARKEALDHVLLHGPP
jgi:Holliday junction DNA helicase RuvB